MYFSKSLFFFLPALLVAGTLGVDLENHQGKSSYNVSSPIQKLEASLKFPFDLNSVGLFYQTNFYGYDFVFRTDLLLGSSVRKGEDFDWYQNRLTVYSSSDNKIDKFQSYSLEVSKDIFESFYITNRFLYKKLNMSWSNTFEEDFVRNDTSINEGLSLTYNQDFYQIDIGIGYEKSLFDFIIVSIEPSFIYTYIISRDKHLLRNFHTLQYSQAIGYGIDGRLSYQLDTNSKVSLDYVYEEYSDDNTQMNYYTSENKNYMSLPAKYSYDNRKFGVSYSYRF